MWPKPIVRSIRFHHRRHTAASLMLRRGASLAVAQRMLRNTDPKITDRMYGHLLPGFLKAEVNRLSFGIAPEGIGPRPRPFR